MTGPGVSPVACSPRSTPDESPSIRSPCAEQRKTHRIAMQHSMRSYAFPVSFGEPDWKRITQFPGRDTRVGGQSARIAVEGVNVSRFFGGSCKRVGGDRTVSVVIKLVVGCTEADARFVSSIVRLLAYRASGHAWLWSGLREPTCRLVNEATFRTPRRRAPPRRTHLRCRHLPAADLPRRAAAAREGCRAPHR